MRSMYDASIPPTNPPRNDGVAGYIGGSTPHVWTDAEWAMQIQKSGAWFKLPIFVRNHPENFDPINDVAIALHWATSHNMQKGACIALDFETAVNGPYVIAFDREVVKTGYKTILYGSIGFVTKNPRPSGGYWIADWTGIPHLVPGSAITQWSGSAPFGGAYDPNLVADSTLLWEMSMPTVDEILAGIRTLKLATHQDMVTIIEGTPQRPANLTAIWKFLQTLSGQGMTDTQVQAAALAMANQLTTTLPPAFIAALKEAL